MRPTLLAVLLAALVTGPGLARADDAAAQPAADLRDVTYTTVPRQLQLDLYLPAGTPPFPLVVWVHGGGWRAGDRRLAPTHPALRQRDRGYAVASIDYRLSGEAIFPAQIQDCKAAIRFLRANAAAYGLDPARVAAWGSSAGGHLVALLGTSGGIAELEDPGQGDPTQSSSVQAVVDWYGPTDFLLQDAIHHQADSPESRLLGCDIDECPDRVALANPITWIDPGDPPFLIEHGTRDGTVAPIASQVLQAALQAATVPSTLVWIEGAGHGGPEFSTAANMATVESFLDTHLSAVPTAAEVPASAEGPR